MNEFNESLSGIISAMEEKLFNVAKEYKVEHVLSQADHEDMDTIYDIYSTEMDGDSYAEAIMIIGRLLSRVAIKLGGLDA